MPRPIYVPIFDSFFESSIMETPVGVRFVFLGLLRLASRPGSDGVVDIPISILAGQLHMPAAEVEAAIHLLMEPDPDSGSHEEEGRRIVPLNPDRPTRGWRLVNWCKYRELVHRANDAERKRREREEGLSGDRLKADAERKRMERDASETSESVHVRPDSSVSGATKRNETIRDDTKPEKERGRRFAPPSVDQVREYVTEKGYPVDPEAFVAFYASKGWKVGNQPMRDWKAALVTWKKRNGQKADGPPAPLVGSHGATDWKARAEAIPEEISAQEAAREKLELVQRLGDWLRVNGNDPTLAMQAAKVRQDLERLGQPTPPVPPTNGRMNVD